MTEQKRGKLKRVLDEVPPGFVVDSRWLSRHGVARSSAHDYDRERWLERIAHGVYRRPSLQTDSQALHDWRVPILSAQWIMHYDFHVGGMSALALDGHDHYLALGRDSDVYLYGRPPTWLPKLPLDTRFRIRSRQKLFGPDPEGVENSDFDPKGADAPNPWNWPFKRSTLERATLEALNELPDKESFHKIDMVFQGLTTLRPRHLTNLLMACKSVKAKRLFFLFADRHRHRWLAHVDRSQIDLGSGPRALVEDGRYAADYQLMVPEEFATAVRQEAQDGA